MNIDPNRTYVGIIWKGEDLQKNLLYPVYIKELSPPGILKLFWLPNEINGEKFCRWLDPEIDATLEQSRKSAGSYFPLQFGMPVEIKFKNNAPTSGYINKIINNRGYNPVNLDISNDFYLLCKTVNDSYIYIDDNRETIHLLNAKGKSNILMDPNRVVLHVGELINEGLDGIKNTSIVEVSKESIIASFENNFIKIDSSGITLSAGENSRNYLQITESGIKFGGAEDILIRADKNLNLIGDKVSVTGIQALDLHSTETRVTGATNLSMTGTTVVVDSMVETKIKSTGHIGLDSLLKIKLTSGIIDISAWVELYNNSLVQINSSQVISNVAPAIANASSIIINDGMTYDNMGFATSMGNTLKGMAMATSIGTELAAASVTSMLHFNDPITSSITNILVAGIPGSASPSNNLTSQPLITKPELAGTNISVLSMNTFNKIGNNNIVPIIPTPIVLLY